MMHKKLTFAAFLLIGCYATAVQVLFLREFMVVFFGNELCLGIILAGWLAGIALGAGCSVRFSDRARDSFPLFMVLNLAFCLAPFFQIHAIRTIRNLLHIPPGEYSTLITLTGSSFLILLPFSLLIGILFPCACTLLGAGAQNRARQIGWVYIFEGIGSLAGGLFLTFFMIPHRNPYEILSLLSILIATNCLLLTLSGSSARRVPLAACFGMLLLTLASLVLSGSLVRLNDYSIQRRWDSYKNNLQLLASVDSPYQNIAVARNEQEYSLFSNGQYLNSFPDPYQTAVFTHLTLSQHPAPRSILLVGGGATGIIQEIMKYPVELVHYVELDPKLLEAGLPFFSREDRRALEDARVTTFFTDGRFYIKKAGETYDMVILNLPDPSTAMLNRFYTLEFFREVRSILRDDGVMVTGISSSVNYLAHEDSAYVSSLYHTLSKVFPHMVIAPGTRTYFFCSPTPQTVTADRGKLAERYLSYSITSDYFTPHHFGMLLPEDRTAFIKRSLEEAPVRINTDTHPITYFYNLILWIMVAGSRGGTPPLRHLIGGVKGLLLAAAVFLALRVLYVLFTEKRVSHHLRFNGLFAIATTGFAGMALELVLLFAFQNIYGYLYHKVGLIIALFMVGLALGGYLMNHLLAGKELNWIRILIAGEVLIGLYACSLPYAIAHLASLEGAALPGSSSLEYLFMLMVVGAGFLTGLEFPLVGRIFITRGAIGSVAGWIDAFDHLGACLGALLTGTILVPLLGFHLSCFFTAALNLGSGLLLAVFLIQHRKAV